MLSLQPADFADLESDISKGFSLIKDGSPKEALELGVSLLATESLNVEVWRLVGVAFMGLDAKAEALEAFETLLSLNPNDVDALIIKGQLLRLLDEIELSIDTFYRALEVDDTRVDAMGELHESVLKLAELPTEDQISATLKCVDLYEQTLLKDPTRIDLYYSLSHMYSVLGRGEDSATLLRKVTELLPTCDVTKYNLATALRDSGETEEAYSVLASVKSPRSDFSGKIEHGLAHLELQKLDFKNGWKNYEGRWNDRHFPPRPLFLKFNKSLPLWDGTPSKHLFAWAEQGIGDEVMFASLIEELNEVHSSLTVACDERLIPIFERSHSESINFVPKRDEIESHEKFDAHIPLGSVLQYLRPDLKSFERARDPYLIPHYKTVSKIRENLNISPGERVVGVSWFSNSRTHGRIRRNIDLDALLRKIGTDNTKFICLQYGDVQSDINRVSSSLGTTVINPNDIDQMKDLDNLFNLAAACDLVVSIDNATLHFCGALGIPTKGLIPFVADWRWGLESSKSYWYSSIDLIRQSRDGNWGEIY